MAGHKHPSAHLHDPVLGWYHANARDLPWRLPDTTPWGVLTSEFMLQQTPVSRVEPVWRRWMDRWPTPTGLAAEDAGEAVRAWGRLGYPRRALRLHASARAIAEHHGGQVPGDLDDLLALPGVGSYTAAAVASFAFGQRHAVLDTNVRRVLARLLDARAQASASQSTSEIKRAEALAPVDAGTAAQWAVAVMELGALVCTAKSPQCGQCPVRDACAWRAAGHPALDTPQRAATRFAGTDRQVRGLLLRLLRESDDPVPRDALRAVWPDAHQRERCLDGLIADGLVEPGDNDHCALPGGFGRAPVRGGF